ncbi:hypothetical protein GCM10028790_30660 [Micromonospora taraxaci]
MSCSFPTPPSRDAFPTDAVGYHCCPAARTAGHATSRRAGGPARARDPVLPNLLLTLVTDGGSDVLIKRFARF